MITLSPPLVSQVFAGGVSVLVADPVLTATGGMIWNPLLAADQGIRTSEPLYLSLIGPAALSVGSGSMAVPAGGSFLVPPGSSVWVNAVSSGHSFSGLFTKTYQAVYPPSPIPGQPTTPGVPNSGGPGAFPPDGPTGLLTDIPMYLYQEYSDDDDLQGYIEAVNAQQQNFVDTFNGLKLPIYTGPMVQGALLDWVAWGLYGMKRPMLTSGSLNLIGPLNTWGCGITQIVTEPGSRESHIPAINEIELIGPLEAAITTDDIFRRILTWHFYKGDGKYFDARWLKRRVWRFLYGTDGTAPESRPDIPYFDEGRMAVPSIAYTDQISISLGVNRNVTIRFVLGERDVIGGAIPNMFGCNGFGPLVNNPSTTPFVPIPLLDLETTYEKFPALPLMNIFQEAISSGVLETPQEFDVTVAIG